MQRSNKNASHANLRLTLTIRGSLGKRPHGERGKGPSSSQLFLVAMKLIA